METIFPRPLEFGDPPPLPPELQVSEPWMAAAECRGQEPSLFILETGQSPRAARAICDACDVQVECLAYAMHNRLDGVYAGTTAKQRRRLRRAQI